MAIRATTARYGRRAMLRLGVAGAATAAAGAVLAACGGETAPTATTVPAVPTTARAATVAPTMAAPTPVSSPATGPPAPAPTVAAPTAAPTVAAAATAAGGTNPLPIASTDGVIASPAPDVPEAYTKIPAPYKTVTATVGRGMRVTTLQLAFFPPIPPRGQNRYWQELEKRLSITYEPTFVPQGEYPAKIATIVAGGEIPDIVHLDLGAMPDQYRVIQQGGYTDLTPFVAGDALKEYPNLSRFSPQVWKNVAVNGKIYGVPWPRIFINGQFMFRQDWAEKVGFPRIRNADDLFGCLIAFTKMDPDGNSRPDTYATSGISPRPDMQVGYFAQMYRSPNNWRLNPDGTLTKNIETPEYRQAVTFARRLWEAGAYYPDAATSTSNQVKEAFIAGKIGGYSDGSLALLGTTQTRFKTLQVNPDAKVIGLVPPGHDGGTPATGKGNGHAGFRAIPARVGRMGAERVKELLRVLDYFAAPFGSEEWRFINNGIEGVHYTVKADSTIERNDLGRSEIGDVTNLMYPNQVFYSDIPGEAADVQQLQKNLLAVAVDDPTRGLFSPTNTMKASELAQLQADRLLEIVSGRAPLDAWDMFVRDWRSRGGDTIRKEYQDALKGQ